jgi:hypothetical protein
MKAVKGYHINVLRLFNNKWKKSKKKENDFYIFLEKDGIHIKVALETGKVFPEDKKTDLEKKL